MHVCTTTGKLIMIFNRFLIREPSLCRDYPDLEIIAYVHSSVRNINNRKLIRDTWGSLR